MQDSDIIQKTKSIILQLHGHAREDLYEYFLEDEKKNVDIAIDLLRYSGSIRLIKTNGQEKLYPYGNIGDTEISEEKRLKKPLMFLRYLMNLKNEDSYLYRDSITTIQVADIPDAICVRINDKLFYITYIPIDDVPITVALIKTNDNIITEVSDVIKRIIVTDADEIGDDDYKNKIEQIKVNNLVNIFSVSSSGNVKLIK